MRKDSCQILWMIIVHSILTREPTPPDDEMCQEIAETSQIQFNKFLNSRNCTRSEVRKRIRKTDSEREMYEVDMAFCKYLHSKSSDVEDSAWMFLLN